MYKVYIVRPDINYDGFALVAAEDVANANELIAQFREFDYDNKYDSYGYCFVGSDDLVEEITADRKGFIVQSIHYRPY